jgi:hypothetical protein
LSHSASFESCDKNAPSKPGTKHLDEIAIIESLLPPEKSFLSPQKSFLPQQMSFPTEAERSLERCITARQINDWLVRTGRKGFQDPDG